MLRYITFILTITLLSGCSELQIIGKAAVRELRADGMNVEAISYNYHQKLAAREQAAGVMVAKAEGRMMASDGNMVGSEKKLRLAKANKVKGLWEKH
jgi:outer membrane murein-binding lipoprotein Lpp